MEIRSIHMSGYLDTLVRELAYQQKRFTYSYVELTEWWSSKGNTKRIRMKYSYIT